MAAGIHLYVEDCDGDYKRALEGGATSIMEPADQFYGDRSAGGKDQFGNRWWIATHKEDLSK
jgi:PhnB protein